MPAAIVTKNYLNLIRNSLEKIIQKKKKNNKPVPSEKYTYAEFDSLSRYFREKKIRSVC